MLVFSIVLLVSTFLPFTVGGTIGHNQRGRHQELAQRARGDVGIHKRNFDNARFTFYDVGLGACGQYSSSGDFMVALNVAQYGDGFPGPQCFKSITISYGGKTAQATIMDKCMGCPYGGLDFSTGLFNYFASEDEGVVYGSWWFNDDASEPTPSASSEWTPTPAPDSSTPAPTRHHHHQAADTPTTTSTASTTAETATNTAETATSTAETATSTAETATSTAETPTSTAETPTSTAETPTITPATAANTPSTTETSATATATNTSLSVVATYDTNIPLPTDVVPIAESVADTANPDNLEVLGEALINLGVLVAGQRGN